MLQRKHRPLIERVRITVRNVHNKAELFLTLPCSLKKLLAYPVLRHLRAQTVSI
jgi:hypothetical protein